MYKFGGENYVYIKDITSYEKLYILPPHDDVIPFDVVAWSESLQYINGSYQNIKITTIPDNTFEIVIRHKKLKTYWIITGSNLTRHAHLLDENHKPTKGIMGKEPAGSNPHLDTISYNKASDKSTLIWSCDTTPIQTQLLSSLYSQKARVYEIQINKKLVCL